MIEKISAGTFHSYAVMIYTYILPLKTVDRMSRRNIKICIFFIRMPETASLHWCKNVFLRKATESAAYLVK